MLFIVSLSPTELECSDAYEEKLVTLFIESYVKKKKNHMLNILWYVHDDLLKSKKITSRILIHKQI